MNHSGIPRIPAICSILLLCYGCTLKVQKLKHEPYGINDQAFVANEKIATWHDTIFRFCCNGTISTHRSLLDKGHYVILLDSKGTPAYNSYPTVKVRVNDSLVKEERLDAILRTHVIFFSLEKKDSAGISLTFDQDGIDNKGNDRDVFIQSIQVRPANQEDTLIGLPINNNQFTSTPGAGSWQGPFFRFCCNGVVSTPRSLLQPGRYEIQLQSKGTPAYNAYPLIRVRLNDSLLKSITLEKELTTYRIPFVLARPDSVAVAISFDQDGADPNGNDRDVYLYSILVSPIGKG